MKTSLFYRIDDAIGAFEVRISQVIAAAIAALLIGQATMRYVFKSPLFWAGEISMLMMLLMTFVGLSVLIHRRNLIGVGVVVDLIPARIRRRIIMLVDISVAAVIAILLFFFLTWLTDPRTTAEVSPTTGYPRWYSYVALPVALTSSLFHSVIAVFRNLEDGAN